MYNGFKQSCKIEKEIDGNEKRMEKDGAVNRNASKTKIKSLASNTKYNA